MATKIRLARRGRKKMAIYDVIVADSRSPRDGKFIEKIGQYNPNTNPATINLEEDRALDWLMKGAQPTDTVRAMFSYKGILLRKHLQVGVIKGAITEEQAEAKYQEWKKAKDEKVNKKVEGLRKEAEADKKSRLEAETKIKEARAEELKKKDIVEEPVAESGEGEAAPEEPADVSSQEASADTPVQEAQAEEPAVEVKEEETPNAEVVEEKVEAEEPKAEEKAEVPAEKEEEPTKEEPKAEAAKEEQPKAEAENKDAAEESKEESTEGNKEDENASEK